ncbi:UTP-glucose-1-phosphate uridylyltransferase [Agrocybe pediades]|nr:UTP-glucose-1-phosphate uridylyltransferase [Agrocybe pediades]
MPLFKKSLTHFRRRSTRYFTDVPPTDPAASVSNELEKLIGTIPHRDHLGRKAFLAEMQSFLSLFKRYKAELNSGSYLDWKEVHPLSNDQLICYDSLPPTDTQISNLDRLAILKVNGGLGTTMGMNGAKCSLEVQNNFTFLDLAVQQVEHLNNTHHADVPLLLMTSFSTAEDTLRIIKKYANKQVKITTFNQSRYPRLSTDTLLPLPASVQEGKSAWYPPGHGDLYLSLYRSGVLDRLLMDGKEYLFVSNSDNLGAIVDPRILQYMVKTQSEFLMEVTSKTKSDVKGGILINYAGSVRLVETPQVPDEFMEEFNKSRSFRMFNTNNLWINLKALKRLMQAGGMALDLIVNTKRLEDGRSMLQLETAAGSAIRHFENAHGIHVPRSRFLPVKDCSDLLLVRSDVFVVEHGRLVPNEGRMFGIPPVIKLGGHFKKVQQFQKRFKQIPRIVELDHLTVAGDVHFGRNVTLRGTVIIVANEGQRIDIPDGCVLENRLVTGNLNMIEL